MSVFLSLSFAHRFKFKGAMLHGADAWPTLVLRNCKDVQSYHRCIVFVWQIQSHGVCDPSLPLCTVGATDPLERSADSAAADRSADSAAGIER